MVPGIVGGWRPRRRVTCISGTRAAATASRRGSTSLEPLFRLGISNRERARVHELLRDPDAWWPHFVRARWIEARLQAGAVRWHDDVKTFVANALAPRFEGQHDAGRALRVVAYALTPAFLASIVIATRSRT